MNSAKEHLEKRAQGIEDRRRRERDLRYRRIELAVMVYAAIVSTISIALSLITLMR